uniref:Activin_recp domain-containing protein n=1 Tax=Globodera pallida TaxID=36090 RepID=A0A183CA20_GLOPA
MLRMDCVLFLNITCAFVLPILATAPKEDADNDKDCPLRAKDCTCGWGACHSIAKIWYKKPKEKSDACCAAEHEWKCCELGPDGQKFVKSKGSCSFSWTKKCISAFLVLAAHLLCNF